MTPLPDDIKQLGDKVAMRIAESICSKLDYMHPSAMVPFAKEELSPILQRLAAARKCVEALKAMKAAHCKCTQPTDAFCMIDINAQLLTDKALTYWAKANKEGR